MTAEVDSTLWINGEKQERFALPLPLPIGTIGTLSLVQPDAPPPSITFHSGSGTDGALFTIKSDGEIVRGPNFTTEDAMSLMFWEIVAKAFPRFLELVKGK